MRAVDIDGDFTCSLRRVRVEEHAAFTAESADFVDGLNRPDLVIRDVDGDQHGLAWD